LLVKVSLCAFALQVISYSSGQIGIGHPDFRKRVGFSMSMPSANLSIYINNTQESDSGRYACNVVIPGAIGLLGELHLNVKGTLTKCNVFTSIFNCLSHDFFLCLL